MKNRKTKIIFFDILTVILLMIQLQSLVVYFVHSLSYSHDLTWTDYLSIYSLYGISYTIYHSSFIYIYILTLFITFFWNIYVITVKTKDIRKKELIHGCYLWFIVTNILFVLLKTIEFYIHLGYIFRG